MIVHDVNLSGRSMAFVREWGGSWDIVRLPFSSLPYTILI